MKTLTALRVIIGRKPNGHALYPDFNALPSVQTAGIDWAYYVDRLGAGWHYDKVSGHDTDTPDSPEGQQIGALLVPVVFRDEAIAAFPTVCSAMTPGEFQTFHDDKVTAHLPDEQFDIEELQGIKMKQDLGQPLTPHQEEALDPNSNTPGIRKSKDKSWVDVRDRKGITLRN